MKTVKIIESPADALHSNYPLIPTKDKIAYYQALLKVGFDTLDCGSFISPKTIPQMADIDDVIKGLDCSDFKTKLLIKIANLSDAIGAIKFKNINYLGYPFSISENFQIRNTGKTIKESIVILEQIVKLAKEHEKEVIIYLSMSFGNPYGDVWTPSVISKWVDQFSAMGIKTISLFDTMGTARIEDINHLFSSLIPQHSELEFGAHFHSQPKSWYDKVNTAFNAGCYRFDGTIKGVGGYQMTQNQLNDNIPTEKLISYFTSCKKLPNSIDVLAFESAYNFYHKLLR